ncbi:MAG: glutamine synthetase beta-grasp domain-containing protein [Candidatus Andersenbacteria bacterium]
MRFRAEYIWIDGGKVLDKEKNERDTAKLRSKTKIVSASSDKERLPEWGFDGSSTYQADTANSDRVLKPMTVVPDPLRGGADVLVLCEVLNFDKVLTPHKSNTRRPLEGACYKYRESVPWVGIEQEYTFFKKGRPLGFPPEGYPEPQGGYYCGVGYDEVFGTEIVEEHTKACLDADLLIAGTNAEVMPGQWEFQVGHQNPLMVADHLWLCRWLLYRIAAKHGAYVKLSPKPVEGDWNGAGAHTNFSTQEMRQKDGLSVIEAACRSLEKRHAQHIAVYGRGNDKRLTGLHETCSIEQFRWGKGDRGASVRIPLGVVRDTYGYLEDRRPAANADPYKVCTALLDTICGEGFDPKQYNW